MDADTLEALGITDSVDQDTVIGFYSKFVPNFPCIDRCMQVYFRGVVSIMRGNAAYDASVEKLKRCVDERNETIRSLTINLN